MNVYVMTCDDPDRGVISKVGVARVVGERRAALERAMKMPVTVVAEFDCGTHARSVEARAHESLSQTALGSEWFASAPDDALAAVRAAMVPRPIPSLGSDPISQDIQEIEAFLSETGMMDSRLGLLACANPRAMARVRDGSARIRTLEEILAFVRRERSLSRRGKEKG